MSEPSTVVAAVEEVVSPTAPGLPPESATPVDLPEVAPKVRAGHGLLLLGIITALAFAALTVAVAMHSLLTGTFDGNLHAWIILHRQPWNIDVARTLTWGGATVVTLPALIVIGAAAPRPPRSWRSRLGSGFLVAGVAALGMALGLVINAVMAGQRPDTADWAGTASGPTFPSGHTTSATIFAACCVWALAPRLRTRPALAACIIAAGAYALVVGLTRAWLGVHWPTDVLGGWLFGISWTALAVSAVFAARQRWRPAHSSAA